MQPRAAERDGPERRHDHVRGHDGANAGHGRAVGDGVQREHGSAHLGADVVEEREKADDRQRRHGHRRSYNLTRRSRSALAITDTELNVMAALAMIGLSRRPANG